MLTDRYGLPLSTTSTAARDDYVLATDRALTFYPGAAEAYDRAIAADPGFALAHGGKAQVLMRQGDVGAAQAALAAAKGVSAGLSEREASHIGFFDLVFAGRTEAAIAALYPHLAAWPRDALVVSVAANPNGVSGGSGRIGQKRQIAEMMDNLASHYGDDFWFTSYHAMALSEDGQLAAARAKIGQSVAANSNNAHGFAHVCYESGDPDTARAFLSSWLATYPRDPVAWRGLYEYAESTLPRPGNGLADLHVILAQAVMGDDAALNVRARQMQKLEREGRYPSGSYLPALARGFASFEREDFSGTIEALAPLAGQNERGQSAAGSEEPGLMLGARAHPGFRSRGLP